MTPRLMQQLSAYYSMKGQDPSIDHNPYCLSVDWLLPNNPLVYLMVSQRLWIPNLLYQYLYYNSRVQSWWRFCISFLWGIGICCHRICQLDQKWFPNFGWTWNKMREYCSSWWATLFAELCRDFWLASRRELRTQLGNLALTSHRLSHPIPEDHKSP